MVVPDPRCGEEVWGTPSNSDAGGGAVRIHKHCGLFNPMNPAAAFPNGGCQPCCLVSGRVCLVGACVCVLARACRCTVWYYCQSNKTI
jgi:hypothetical protein